jgi:hypothetical protein
MLAHTGFNVGSLRVAAVVPGVVVVDVVSIGDGTVVVVEPDAAAGGWVWTGFSGGSVSGVVGAGVVGLVAAFVVDGASTETIGTTGFSLGLGTVGAAPNAFVAIARTTAAAVKTVDVWRNRWRTRTCSSKSCGGHCGKANKKVGWPTEMVHHPTSDCERSVFVHLGDQLVL